MTLLVRLVVALKELAPLLGRNALPEVANCDFDDLVTDVGQLHVDRAGPAVLDRVVQQIGEDLLEAKRVDIGLERACAVQLDLMATRQGLGGGCGLLE